MIKAEELANPESCMGKAHPREMTFVLLARDIAAPGAIREWCRLRCLHGKNKATDEQIREALACAETMEKERNSKSSDPIQHSFTVPLPSGLEIRDGGAGEETEGAGMSETMDYLTPGQRADVIADLARQQSCTIALLEAEVKRLTDCREGMTDREKLIREGFCFDSDRDCEAARYLIGVIDVIRGDRKLSRDQADAAEAKLAELQHERDGIAASFEHDADCLSLTRLELACDCSLWLRVRKDRAEAVIATLPTPERLEEMADEIHRMARWGLSGFNSEMRIAMAAELRAVAEKIREAKK